MSSCLDAQPGRFCCDGPGDIYKHKTELLIMTGHKSRALYELLSIIVYESDI